MIWGRTAQVWAAPLAGGSRAVVLFNRHVASDEKFDVHNMTLRWSMIGYPDDLEVCACACVPGPCIELFDSLIHASRCLHELPAALHVQRLV